MPKTLDPFRFLLIVVAVWTKRQPHHAVPAIWMAVLAALQIPLASKPDLNLLTAACPINSVAAGSTNQVRNGNAEGFSRYFRRGVVTKFR